MNVLIVDDDQMICDGTARRLEKSGIQEITDITCAYSAEEAMAIFEKKTIHVLFSDIRMNGLTGLELIEAVKRLQPYVICIIVTAYDQFQYAQQAIRVGVHEFLVKPCSGREMRDQALHAMNRMQDSEPQRRRMLDEALRYAKEHICDQLDMAVVANAMNLSYSYFSRIFHEETGMTFSKYMQKLRIEEAGKMLLAGEKLVEIAAKLGYQNAANLTRAFTRELGMSPSQWMDRQIKQ